VSSESEAGVARFASASGQHGRKLQSPLADASAAHGRGYSPHEPWSNGWEDGADEYAALVTSWWRGGYATTGETETGAAG
jgi:hypothetical protein